MNRKPGAFWHMMAWGTVSGTILGSLFLMFFMLLGGEISFVFRAIPFVGIFAFIFGGIPGAILGFIEAFFVRKALADIPHPFTKAHMLEKRSLLYWAVFPIPFLASLILSMLFWIASSEAVAMLGYWFIFGIPTLIASFASVYVAHRYMFRLRLWSESQFARKEKPKMKAKRTPPEVNRLIDTEVDESYYENDSGIFNQQRMD